MPYTDTDILAYQPIEGVPVIRAGKAYICIDGTGVVWERTKSTSGNTTTVTVKATFTQGAVFTMTGTLAVDSATGKRTYTPTSWGLEEDEEEAENANV